MKAKINQLAKKHSKLIIPSNQIEFKENNQKFLKIFKKKIN